MLFISTKWLFALAFHKSQPIFEKQALRHRMSHFMTDSKSTLRTQALGSHYIQDEVSVIGPTYAGM